VQNKIEFFRFSTDDLPERDRISIWREVFGRAVVKVDMEPCRDRPFHSEASIRVLPNLTICSISTTPNRVRRTQALVSDGSDDLVFTILLQGEAVATQANREARLEAGEALLWLNELPGGWSYDVPIEFLTLAIPKAVLSPSLAHPEDLRLQVISRERDALRFLTRYVRLLHDTRGEMPPELKAVSSAHIGDLVALVLGASRDVADRRGVRASRLSAIKADIRLNLGNRDLSAESIAARHGISPRYIRSLFSTEETNFTHFLLGLRLAKVHRRLGDPRYVHHTISAIAFECGFGDLSYFNRAFRAKYGATPSDVRAAFGQ